jgi:hypothetical protein
VAVACSAVIYRGFSVSLRGTALDETYFLLFCALACDESNKAVNPAI